MLPLLPVFLSYVLSFIYVGIYWNNHRHMLHATERVSGGILWANLHLLFWLSLIPFVTAWMGENHFSATPTALYGFVLLMAAVAYFTLQRVIIADQGDQPVLAQAVGRDIKGKLSPPMYIGAILLAFYDQRIFSSFVRDRRTYVAYSGPANRKGSKLAQRRPLKN